MSRMRPCKTQLNRANHSWYLDAGTIRGVAGLGWFCSYNLYIPIPSIDSVGLSIFLNSLAEKKAKLWSPDVQLIRKFFPGKQTVDAQKIAALIHCAQWSSLIRIRKPQQCWCLFLLLNLYDWQRSMFTVKCWLLKKKIFSKEFWMLLLRVSPFRMHTHGYCVFTPGSCSIHLLCLPSVM